MTDNVKNLRPKTARNKSKKVNIMWSKLQKFYKRKPKKSLHSSSQILHSKDKKSITITVENEDPKLGNTDPKILAKEYQRIINQTNRYTKGVFFMTCEEPFPKNSQVKGVRNSKAKSGRKCKVHSSRMMRLKKPTNVSEIFKIKKQKA